MASAKMGNTSATEFCPGVQLFGCLCDIYCSSLAIVKTLHVIDSLLVPLFCSAKSLLTSHLLSSILARGVRITCEAAGAGRTRRDGAKIDLF